MNALLGPVPCGDCRDLLVWYDDHLWHDSAGGPIHRCPGLRPIPKSQYVDPHLGLARHILRSVALEHSLRPEDVIGRKRHRPIARARYEATYRMWHETHLSLRIIGQILDGRDHSSVHYLIAQHIAGVR